MYGYKKEVMVNLKEMNFNGNTWLCTESGKRVVRVGEHSPLFKQLNCCMTVGIHATIEYQMTVQTASLISSGREYAVLQLPNFRYSKI